MLDPAAILDKIDRLRELDPNRALFGAWYHGYRLNPPLAEATITSVENRYSIRLPGEYRAFLLKVGDGGAGPFYGLFRLGEQDHGMGSCSWADGYLLGDPAAPFLHEDSWNLPEAFWSEAPHNQEWPTQEEEDRAYETWDAQLDELYWAPSVMNGAIPVCHRGCLLRQWLVVTGPKRGNIWEDDRVDYAGISPLLSPRGGRVSFSAWYCGWLDRSIAAAKAGRFEPWSVP